MQVDNRKSIYQCKATRMSMVEPEVQFTENVSLRRGEEWMWRKAAVVFEEVSGNFSIEQLEISDPNDNEVMVRIVGCGICHTDLGPTISICQSPCRACSDTKARALLSEWGRR